MAALIEIVAKLLGWLGLVAFWLLLGWTLPFLVITPFGNLFDIFDMLSTGKVPAIAYSPEPLVLGTLAMWYLYTNPRIGGILKRMPVLRPALIMAWIMAVATWVTLNLVYRGLLQHPEQRLLVAAEAIALLFCARAAISWIFTRKPALEMVRQANQP